MYRFCTGGAKRNDSQAGDAVKVASVARADGVAEFQCTSSDHEIAQRKIDAGFHGWR